MSTTKAYGDYKPFKGADEIYLNDDDNYAWAEYFTGGSAPS